LKHPSLRILCATAFGLTLAALRIGAEPQELVVTATAYNSLPDQTSGNPTVGAWGDRIAPGMKVVAVSRDLLAAGLQRGTALQIEGLSGEYVVLDKTAARWHRRIDIYMGVDRDAAVRWGKRTVRISWQGK